MERQDIERRLATAASVVKLVCGVGNNAAWFTMLEALDHARQCRRYKHTVKREFNRAVEMFHRYERELVNNQHNRMFHLADMSDAVRKKYGDISDREYYDFWKSIGGKAYQAARPQLTSLHNKYRLSLQQHGVPFAERVAWVMVAQSTLELAVKFYHSALQEANHDDKIPQRIMEHIFGQFSLAAVRRQWRIALALLSPESERYDLDKVEERNIEMGLIQLEEALSNPSIFYDSTLQSVEDYDDIFRTKGENKKAMREIANLKNETLQEL